ncbi:hypothetical protein QPM17_18560 [Marinobacter sp. TBZ242]|uniref:SMODS and SLOG-associating 2TM effector domain-containing protein n=1 Tax=Marinobacter azerbaijanicus TaxID=3050455 RepID=A0ABT7IG46_9GAMM|nr:hypothetical protein [Marinobacter sp. TBZ242]MDL0433147.1 hypothetical protein [Marinobacter sp. TBZ242]
MTQEDVSHHVANQLMTEMARSLSESHSKFSGWLLAGSSAIFGLILANLDSVSTFVAIDAVKSGTTYLLWSLIVAVVHRWLFSIVQAGIQGGDRGAQMDQQIRAGNYSYNQEVLCSEIENASFYPAKWIIRWQYRRLKNGDITVAGRQHLKLAQIQGFCLLLQILLAVASVAVLVSGLNA